VAFYVHGRHVPAAVMRIFLSREELHLCSRRAIRLISGLCCQIAMSTIIAQKTVQYRPTYYSRHLRDRIDHQHHHCRLVAVLQVAEHATACTIISTCRKYLEASPQQSVQSRQEGLTENYYTHPQRKISWKPQHQNCR